MFTWVQQIINFFNSTFFFALVTGATGSVAIWIYYKQKAEKKQQIATVLVNEIRNAESSITTIRQQLDKEKLADVSVLPKNTWKEYSYLFSNDFDQDENKQINTFYYNAEKVHKIVYEGSYLKLFFMEVGQRANAIQKKLIDMLDTSTNPDEAMKKVEEFKAKLAAPGTGIHYGPMGFRTHVKPYIREIPFILNTPTGERLKKLAGLR